MKKNVIIALCLSAVFADSQGMKEDCYRRVDTRKDLVQLNNVKNFIDNFFPSTQNKITIEERHEWNKQENTKGYKDPQLFEITVENNETKKISQYVIKASKQRAFEEIAGSKRLEEKLNGQFSYSFPDGKVNFYPIKAYEMLEVQVNDAPAGVCLQLMEKAQGQPLISYWDEEISEGKGSPDKCAKLFRLFGYTLGTMHEKWKFSHGDLHWGNIIVSYAPQQELPIISIIDYERIEQGYIDPTGDVYLAITRQLSFIDQMGVSDWPEEEDMNTAIQRNNNSSKCLYYSISGFFDGYDQVAPNQKLGVQDRFFFGWSRQVYILDYYWKRFSKTYRNLTAFIPTVMKTLSYEEKVYEAWKPHLDEVPVEGENKKEEALETVRDIVTERMIRSKFLSR